MSSSTAPRRRRASSTLGSISSTTVRSCCAAGPVRISTCRSSRAASRRDEAVNATAMAKVRDDKERESGDGFDGTWVAHPDLVPLATEIFDGVLGAAPHQKDRLREDVAVSAEQLRDLRVAGGTVTEAGLRLNISVAVQYLDAWLGGNGAAAINNLMEDAATAEISRSQLWQWRTMGTRLDDGRSVTGGLYSAIRDEGLAALGGAAGGSGQLPEAAELLDRLVLADDFAESLPPPAYPLPDGAGDAAALNEGGGEEC